MVFNRGDTSWSVADVEMYHPREKLEKNEEFLLPSFSESF